MEDKYIYVKLIKVWSRFKVGDVIRFGRSKGLGRINAGEGVEVPKQKAVNGPSKEDIALAAKKKAKRTETAAITPPGEKAVLDTKAKADAKAKAKAKADAKAKAKEEAKTEKGG